MAGNSKRDIVHIESSAGTGYRYTITKNKRLHPDKVEYKNWYPGQASSSIHPSNGTIQTYGWIHTDWVGKWDDHFDSNDVGTSATHGIAEIPICN